MTPTASAGDSLELQANDPTTGDHAVADFTDAASHIGSITTTASGTYGPGSTLTFTVNFVLNSNGNPATETVITTGGNTVHLAEFRWITPTTAVGLQRSTLTFSYTVASGESAAHLRLQHRRDPTQRWHDQQGTGVANNANVNLPAIGSANDAIYNANITIDSGPTVSSVTVTPSPTNVGPAISATFTASTNAEYFIDSPGTPGTGTAMTVSGGTSATGTMTSAQFTPLTQGTHYVYVEAKDAAGIWSSPYSSYQTFVKDTVGPVVPVFTVTPNTTNVGPTITVTGLPDSSGVGAAEYFLTGQSGATPGTGTPLTVSPVGGTSVTATGTITDALFNALAAGTNTVYVDAQDSLGNWSATKRAVTFFKDVTPPTVTVLTANPATATATSPFFSMTVTDNKGIAGAEYFIDTAGAPGTGTAISISGTTIASTNFSLSSFSSISDGPHTFIAEAKDTAGNWSGPASCRLRVSRCRSSPTGALRCSLHSLR